MSVVPPNVRLPSALFVAISVFFVPDRADAGCTTCTSTASCNVGFTCEYDESWMMDCCVPQAQCQIQSCMDNLDCGELGSDYSCVGGCCMQGVCPNGSCGRDPECVAMHGTDWICVDSCCQYSPPMCNTAFCDFDNDCAELGTGYYCPPDGCCRESAQCVESCAEDPSGCRSGLTCIDGCCIATECTNTCRALLDCQDLGSDWVCDTAAGCCAQVGGGCTNSCESIGGCSELGAGWECDTAAGCCVQIGALPDSGTCETCESLDGCGHLGSGWVCDTAESCCVNLGGQTRDGGSGGNTPPLRTTTGGAERRRGCGCGAATEGPPRSPLAALLLLGIILAIVGRRVVDRR